MDRSRNEWNHAKRKANHLRMPLSAVEPNLRVSVYTTYENLHGKLFDRNAYKISSNLTSKRQRFLKKSPIRRFAQLNVRFPLFIEVSNSLSVASFQLHSPDLKYNLQMDQGPWQLQNDVSIAKSNAWFFLFHRSNPSNQHQSRFSSANMPRD